MIPKIIHYCWFGYSTKPKLIQKCIASWKQYMPDWEIREWNEETYDVNKNLYIQQAYEKKKWAFVVDYARFDILNQFGGIFLDTDVELLKSIPEEILSHEAFSGFENPGRVNPGLVYGSIPGQKILREIMWVYENKTFGEKIDGRIENIVDVVSGVLKKSGLKANGEFQIVDKVAIYPFDYFCAFDHETQSFEIKEHTISIHHYFASWSPWYRKLRFRMIKVAVKLMGRDRYLALKRLIKNQAVIICRKRDM